MKVRNGAGSDADREARGVALGDIGSEIAVDPLSFTFGSGKAMARLYR
jgi:hypothetical protein